MEGCEKNTAIEFVVNVKKFDKEKNELVDVVSTSAKLEKKVSEENTAGCKLEEWVNITIDPRNPEAGGECGCPKISASYHSKPVIVTETIPQA